MPGPSVRLHIAGVERDVRSGGIVGRLPGAELRVLDPRVSEAHAMVSLRAVGFQLLALRGELWLDGEQERTVDIRPGLRVELARGMELEVLDTTLPEVVVAARVDDGPSQFLWADLYTVMPHGRLEVAPGYHADAAGWLLPSAGEWLFQAIGGPMVPCRAGATWPLSGSHHLEAVPVPVDQAFLEVTQSTAGTGLHIVGRTDTAHLQRPGRLGVVLTGLLARLITELGLMGAAVDWRVVSSTLWPDDHEVDRRKYDRLTRRLRIKLREHGVRTDLVRPTNTGMVELYLHAADRFEDDA